MEVGKETQRCHQEIITKVNIEITQMNHEIKTLKNERKTLCQKFKGFEDSLQTQEEQLIPLWEVLEWVHEAHNNDKKVMAIIKE